VAFYYIRVGFYNTCKPCMMDNGADGRLGNSEGGRWNESAERVAHRE